MKRCPHCDHGDLRVPETLTEYPAVHCTTCGALGPEGESPAEAQAAWERRPGESRRLVLGLIIGATVTALVLGTMVAVARNDAAAALESVLREQAAVEAAAFDRGWEASRRCLVSRTGDGRR